MNLGLIKQLQEQDLFPSPSPEELANRKAALQAEETTKQKPIKDKLLVALKERNLEPDYDNPQLQNIPHYPFNFTLQIVYVITPTVILHHNELFFTTWEAAKAVEKCINDQVRSNQVFDRNSIEDRRLAFVNRRVSNIGFADLLGPDYERHL